ncbi:4'-phosphopantetheinyl transferase family protein [Micromonospora pattaloongensis]|uniref:4'-phosphopantetheinyl transferase family protein n=1 Tax=Micromonospora pattaloongensis TaxID=405436 RepID=UPI0015873C87|nr:4'-phosphopantetheinyl transferase superfamily protein [Micromonospora pattaloongensis]
MRFSEECFVWWAPVSAAAPLLVHLLDDVERQRISALRRSADRARSLLGAAVLRLVVERHTGVPASRVTVHRACNRCGGPHGRPRVPGTGLHVSVSHSGDWVAVALTEAGEVGVDVEREAPIDVDELRSTVLAPGEAVRGVRDFLVCWTRKEAILKATGDGLMVPMTQVSVGAPDTPPVLGGYPDRPGLVAQLFDLVGREGHVAALAAVTETALTIRELDATALLAGMSSGQPASMDLPLV